MPRRETVTRVLDGDTFKTASRKRSVRLAVVDTPEAGTRSATQATAALKKLILGKPVVVDTQARDVYGRAVAKVRVNGKSVNKAMKRYER